MPPPSSTLNLLSVCRTSVPTNPPTSTDLSSILHPITKTSSLKSLTNLAAKVHADSISRPPVRHAAVLAHIGHVIRSATTVRSKRASGRIFQTAWAVSSRSPPRAVVDLLEGGLDPPSDIPADHHACGWRCLHRAVREIPTVAAPDLLRVLLARLALSHVSFSSRYATLVFLIFDTHSFSEQLCVTIEVLVAEYPIIFSRIVSAIPQSPITSSRIAALFCLLRSATSENDHTIISQPLSRLLNPDSRTVFKVPDASSSHDDPTIAVWTAFVNLPELSCRSDAIADFLETHLWSCEKSVRQAATRILYHLFVSVSVCRQRVLNSMLSAISSQNTPPSILQSFSQLFESLVEKSAYLLVEFHYTFSAFLPFLDTMSPHIDTHFTKALTGLASKSPPFLEAFMVYVRKSSTSRSWKLQRISIAAFLHLISQPTLQSESVQEACESLLVMLQISDPHVISHLVRSLLVLPDTKHDISQLERAILQRAFNIGRVNHESHPNRMDFTVCIQNARPKDAYTLLLRFCAKKRSVNESAHTFFRNLQIYLSDASAVRDALRKHPQEDVSTLIAYLCEIFQTIAELDTAHVAALLVPYAVSLLVRNHLGGKVLSGASDNLLECMTAREAALSGFTDLSGEEICVNELSVVFLQQLLRSPDGVLKDVVIAEVLHVLFVPQIAELPITDLAALLECIVACYVTSWNKNTAPGEGLESGGQGADKIGSGCQDEDGMFGKLRDLVRNSEAKDAVEDTQLHKAHIASCLSIRQSSLQLLSKLHIQHSTNLWDSVHEMMTGSEKCCHSQICTMEKLTTRLREEFDKSLTASLTIAYLDIISLIIKDDTTSDITSLVKSGLLSLLRDYSISHAKVLKPLLGLLFKSCADLEAIQLAASIVDWLAHDGLLKPDNNLRVSEFDEDIIADAVNWDEDRHNDAPSVDPEGDTRMESRTVGEEDSVKSLCLNETPESAAISLSSCFSQVETSLVKMIDGIRTRKSDTSSENPSFNATMHAASTLLETRTRWPAALHKKCGRLAHLLCETCETTLMYLKDKEVGEWIAECMPRALKVLYGCRELRGGRFNIETLDVAAAALPVEVRGRVGVPEETHEEEGEEEEGEMVRMVCRGKRRRVRSRNFTIDAWLGEDGANVDEDRFADLEDFIAPME